MLKKYGQFIKESNIDIDSICKIYKIKNYTINSDLTVDVDDTVNISNEELTELPLKFGKVSGHFYCENNNLTSLLGSPQTVGGFFDCYNNCLTSLLGSPKEVGGNFNCENNNLTSLLGSPKTVGGYFSCNRNKIINFKQLPITYKYYLENNPIDEFLKYFDNYEDKRNLGEYLRLFEDIVQFPYLDDLEFEELAKCLKHKLPENWRDSVTSYKMLSEL